ncbi:MAG: GNAT family N-acetyltransferase [Clostridia bacterium]|nr:GNAT family N-acetyltransferase [Clostridia bacterium]
MRIIQTERLLLRPFNPDDLPAILRIYGDVQTNTYLPWFPIQTMEEAREFYEKHLSTKALGSHAIQWAICPIENGEPFGYVGVERTGAHDFGYGLRSDCQGKGYMTEAASAIVHTLRKAGIPFITATHDQNNPRSGAVMRRIGMKYGYSYRERWMPKDISVVFRLYQLNLDGQEQPFYSGYWNRYADHFIEALE